MTSAVDRAEAQLWENEKIRRLKPADVVAPIMTEFWPTHDRLQEMVKHHRQYKSEAEETILLVHALFGTMSDTSAGRAQWIAALPTGTAPAFRRAMQALLTKVRSIQ